MVPGVLVCVPLTQAKLFFFHPSTCGSNRFPYRCLPLQRHALWPQSSRTETHRKCFLQKIPNTSSAVSCEFDKLGSILIFASCVVQARVVRRVHQYGPGTSQANSRFHFYMFLVDAWIASAVLYACTIFGLLVCVFPGVFLSSRVTGACSVTTNLTMRVNVRTTKTTPAARLLYRWMWSGWKDMNSFCYASLATTTLYYTTMYVNISDLRTWIL